MSLTVTVKLQVSAFPALSSAMQITIEFPTGKEEPEGGVQLTVAGEQFSTTVGAG